jgi:LacI family transcriptional regulator
VTDNDHHGAMRTIMEVCRERGYQRPALIISPTYSERTGHRWLAAYLMELFLFFPGAKPLVLIRDRKPTELISPEIAAWVHENQPDVIIANVVRATWEVEMAKLSRPTGLVTLGIRELPSNLAGIDQKHSRTGALAIELLVGKMQRNETGCREQEEIHLVQGAWHDGASLPTLRRSTKRASASSPSR